MVIELLAKTDSSWDRYPPTGSEIGAATFAFSIPTPRITMAAGKINKGAKRERSK